MSKEKKRKLLIILLCIGMAICIGITIWALFFRGGGGISPDYPPQGLESNQTPIDGDNSGKLDNPEGGAFITAYFTRQTGRFVVPFGDFFVRFKNPLRNRKIRQILEVHSGRLLLVRAASQRPELPRRNTVPLAEALRKVAGGAEPGFQCDFADGRSGGQQQPLGFQ